MSSGGGLKNREEQSKKLEVTVYNGRRGREGEPSTSTANCIEMMTKAGTGGGK